MTGVSSYLYIVKNEIKQRRLDRHESQAELAAAVMVSRQTIIAIERGRYQPSLPLAFALAAHFGARVDELFHPEPGLRPVRRDLPADG
jgi:putative transcriptional regulator